VEYQLHGVDFDRRGAVADEKLERLLELLDEAGVGTAEPRITPAPFTSPRPMLAWGGRSKAAARRAGRHGLHFLAQGGDAAALGAVYSETAAANGHEPGMCFVPADDAPLIVFVNDDVDTGWEEVGPSMLVDAVSYHAWNEAAGTAEGTASLTSARSVDELRVAEGAHRVVTPEVAADFVRTYGPLGLHPLCGGLDPDVAWPYLRRAVAAANGALSG
jgi:alkanesulfonate monooxygenase SsuD/methylene tetrahydromethanopterin reductase-like flavin-dependent oxidoreductase (luciferase family)